MQPARIYLTLAALVMGLPLIGFIWPQSASLTGPLAERDWQWPSAQVLKDIEPQPKLLARFWPVQEKAPQATAEETAQATADALARQTMKLVAIVRQGQQQQALVLTPSGELKTLNNGDLLDQRRRISAITASGLHWQLVNEGENKNKNKAEPTRGELVLFPRPPALLEPEQSAEVANGTQAIGSNHADSTATANLAVTPPQNITHE